MVINLAFQGTPCSGSILNEKSITWMRFFSKVSIKKQKFGLYNGVIDNTLIKNVFLCVKFSNIKYELKDNIISN